ncbi:hypothetical protein GCM10011613_10590 [Cellvibrio zantedeschiae]|uniref:Uncharacterized protein n=1 Tax=Cellvibrio zantedeschiae TaxID=1237077 RepID=A0ABQ3AUJ9_9GAMM|nr:hypothetical protein [Cellvibrio zantedeschiae]GGY68265.1 hypothetical protein GCM10011613_10590 [Cellvibrio zantedeschiae]
MGVLQGVSAQSIARKRYSPKLVPQQYSLWVFFFTFIIHLAIIFVAMKGHHHKSEQVEMAINLVPMYVVADVPVFSVEAPAIQSDIQLSSPVSPELIFPEPEKNVSTLNMREFLGQETYEFPTKKSGRYKDVFNPELRKKLQDLPERKVVKPKIQYLGVGITLEDIGNGMCLYGDAFLKTGYKVKCGPDQGEQMMINMEHALADPLHLNE